MRDLAQTRRLADRALFDIGGEVWYDVVGQMAEAAAEVAKEPKVSMEASVTLYMLNQKLFARLKKEYDTYEAARRELIGVSNNALSKAKQAIFALHRDDENGAARLLREVEGTFAALEKKFQKIEGLRWEGAYRAALEEYAEAKLFYEFLRTGKVAEIKTVPLDAESYFAGLSDLTGELTRKCVQRATEGRTKDVENLTSAVRAIVGELIKFDLTGYLRTKYDQAKQNLRRVEEVLYDIKMRR